MKFEVRDALWAQDQAQLKAVRQAVFVEEQAVPADLEWDGKDAGSQHVVAFADGRCVGTGRLETDGKIGRMAVLADARGCGVGAAILECLVQRAAACGMDKVYLHAQCHALDFYSRHHFAASGPVFDEAGIPHRLMNRKIS